MGKLTDSPASPAKGRGNGEFIEAFRIYARSRGCAAVGLAANTAVAAGTSATLTAHTPEERNEELLLRAVTRCLYRLSRRPQGQDILKIIEIVCFAAASAPLRKGDISTRVVKAAMQLHYSERQIYYCLRQARETLQEVLFEMERLPF